MCKNKQSTSKQPSHCGLLPALAQPSPHPPRTRGTFHRRPEPLYTEKHKVSCPGFLPKRSPCNIYNASCNVRIQTRISRRTWQHKTTTIMQPLQCVLQAKIPNHHVTAMCKTQPAPAEHTRYLSSQAGAEKNTRFPAPAFSQNEAHATSTQPWQCVLQHQVPNPHLTHTATQNNNNHAAITMRSASKDSKTPCNCNVQE